METLLLVLDLLGTFVFALSGAAVLKGGGRGPTKIGVVPLSDGAGEVAAIRMIGSSGWRSPPATRG
jgi:hypothetical protein